MNTHEPRLRKLRQLLRKAKVDALLVTSEVNVSYLTGFTGDDSYLLVTTDSELLVTDPRYTLQLERECPGLKLLVRQPGQKMHPTLIDLIKRLRVDRLGVEGASMPVAVYRELEKGLPEVSIEVCEPFVEQLRIIKDRSEVEAIRVAGELARRAFEVVRAGLTPEQTESQVAADLEHQARRFGGQGLSFPAIVAVGPQGALPHYRPGSNRIGDADFTLIDWGVNSGRYMSDLTRMVVTGRITDRFKKLYSVVLEAQLAAIAAIRPDVNCQEVDAAARKVIDRAGFGDHFQHGTGHGLGMQVHEAPSLGKNLETKLRPGMVVTVEPGVYFAGWGGIRIEDDVLVTKTGAEVLTTSPKSLDDCLVR